MTTTFTHYFFIKHNEKLYCKHITNSSLDFRTSIFTDIFWPPPNFDNFLNDFGSADYGPFGKHYLKFAQTHPHLVTIQQMELDLRNQHLPRPDAACFFDIDSKLIAIFEDNSGPTQRPIRLALISLMRQLWPGWQIYWTDKGYTELLQLIGYTWLESDVEIESLSPMGQISAWFDMFYGFSPLEHQARYSDFIPDALSRIQVDPEPDRFPYIVPGCIVTLKDQDSTSDYGFSEGGTIFCLGEALLEKLESLPPLESYRPPVKLRETLHTPYSGIFINTIDKQISFWLSHYVHPLLIKAIQDIWQGWQVSWHTLGLAHQYELAGYDPGLVLIPFKEIRTEVRSFVGGAAPVQENRHQSLPTLKELLDAFEPTYPNF